MQRPMQLTTLHPDPEQRYSSAPAAPPPRAKLVAEGISKRYGSAEVLHPTDLTIAAGELLTVLGPSGSGKTTLLQIICGLVEPTSGRLFIDGQDQTHTPAHRRDMGVVFQNYALFPHLTVSENVAFPLQMRHLAAHALKAKVAAVLDMVGLGAFSSRFPRELSGGQQQRVALARCLVYQPALILMDEPLGALDRKLRETMQIEIKRLHRETGATIVFVTHDQDEALALSDRICLMNGGHIEQIGTPQDIYERPLNTFVADFIGISNVLRGKVGATGDCLITADGELTVPSGTRATPGHSCALVIRPEHLAVVPPDSGGLAGTVVETVYAGAETRLLVALASGTVLTVRHTGAQRSPDVGAVVAISWDRDRARLLAT